MRASRAILVGSAPYIHDRRTTAGDAWVTVAALLPLLVWGALIQGTAALVLAGVSILAAVLGDALQSGLRRRFELDDGTAVLTGLLIGLSLPAGIPVHVPVAAALFAVLVVKGAFGGLGNNWMNPALAGIVFAWLNWRGLLAQGLAAPAFASAGFESLGGRLDAAVSSAFNALLFNPLSASLPDGRLGPLLGFSSGAPGTISPILILLVSAVLVGRGVIRWKVPALFMATYAGLAFVFGGLLDGGEAFKGDLLGALLSGSLLFVAFFMATDPVTSPASPLPLAVYAIGSGALAFGLAVLDAPTNAPAAAVIVANCFMPWLEEKTRARRRARRRA